MSYEVEASRKVAFAQWEAKFIMDGIYRTVASITRPRLITALVYKPPQRHWIWAINRNSFTNCTLTTNRQKKQNYLNIFKVLAKILNKIMESYDEKEE